MTVHPATTRTNLTGASGPARENIFRLLLTTSRVLINAATNTVRIMDVITKDIASILLWVFLLIAHQGYTERKVVENLLESGIWPKKYDIIYN